MASSQAAAGEREQLFRSAMARWAYAPPSCDGVTARLLAMTSGRSGSRPHGRWR